MKWRTYVRLGRVSNLPTVWTNVLAGVVLAGGALEPGTLAALIVALSLFYVGGMYLNDAFDRKIDARERPERPIPSGLISAREVFAIGFGMLAAAVLVLVGVAVRRAPPLNWLPVASGVALAAVVTYYDAVHKRDPLSPLVMGLCRVLTYVIAAVAVAGAVPGRVVAAALVLLSYLIGLTYVAKQETLAEYRNLWPLAFLFAPFAYAAPFVGRSPTAAVIYVGFLAWVVYAILFLVRRGRVNIPRAVISFIAGISLLDALLIAGAGRAVLAIGAIGGFGLTLVGQRWVRGT
jgi:hypothetical protein